MTRLLTLTVLSIVSIQPIWCQRVGATELLAQNNTAPAGVGERVGESVDRGLSNIGERIRKTWADFRKSVDELSVQGRVYARVHWDKNLANAPIEIAVQNENVVTLSGSVPNEAARRAAVTLANDTVGVGKVIDHLTVGATTTTTTTTTTVPSSSAPTVPPLNVPNQ